MVRKGLVAALFLVLMFGAFALGRASERDETVLTVQVTSADHELQSGYFSLGAETTLLVKPGSPVFRFLSRHRGQKITLTMSQTESRTLSRLDR